MTAIQVRFHVGGTPAPQGSKSVSRTGHLYETSRRVGPWRAAVAAAATVALRGREPLSGPVAVEITFYLLRPRSHYVGGRRPGDVRATAPAHMAYRPDLDKLARSTLDALTVARAFVDDSQVVSLTASKRWSAVTSGADIAIMAVS